MRFSYQWKWRQTLQADLDYPCWEQTCHPVSHVVPRLFLNLQFSLNKAYWFFPKIFAHDWHLRHTWPVTGPLLIPTNPCPLMMMDKDLAQLHASEHIYPWSFMFSVFFLSHFIRFTWTTLIYSPVQNTFKHFGCLHFYSIMQDHQRRVWSVPNSFCGTTMTPSIQPQSLSDKNN